MGLIWLSRTNSLDPVGYTSDPVFRLLAGQGQQPHYDERPPLYERVRAAGRGLDCLPHFVAV
jgi:hypothetical protein